MKLPHPVHPTLEDKQLMTVKEVALLLRISRSALYRLIERGELPSLRLGHSVRLRADDVLAFMRGTRRLPVQDAHQEPDTD